MRRFYLILLALSFICAPAWGDTSPTRIGDKKGTCQKFIMCAAQTATGICTVSPASGDEIILNTFGLYSNLTFYSNESAAAHSCHVFSNNTGWDADNDAVQVSTTELTETTESITLSNGNFGFIWIQCTAITTDVTVTVNACLGN